MANIFSFNLHLLQSLLSIVGSLHIMKMFRSQYNKLYIANLPISNP